MKSKGSNEEKDPKDELKKLGQRIKELRIQKGYSSYETFAYENNISRAQIGRYETGQDIRYTTLLRVIQALGVTPSEFFSEGID